MSDLTEYEITETMIRYGGGFVVALAKAHRLADMINKKRLERAFPEYWKQYREMTIRLQGRNA